MLCLPIGQLFSKSQPKNLGSLRRLHGIVLSLRTLETQVWLDLKPDPASPHTLRERMELVHAQRQAPVRHRHRVAVHCGAQPSCSERRKSTTKGRWSRSCAAPGAGAAPSQVTDHCEP